MRRKTRRDVFQTVAKELGVSRGTAKKYYYAARKLLGGSGGDQMAMLEQLEKIGAELSMDWDEMRVRELLRSPEVSEVSTQLPK